MQSALSAEITVLQSIIEFIVLVVVTAVGVTQFVRKPLVDQINGLGTRVQTLEAYKESSNAQIATLTQMMRDAATDRNHLHEQMGKVLNGQEASDTIILDMKLQIVGEMAGIKNLLGESNGKLRERIVRIETIQRIEEKLGVSSIDDLEHNG